MNSKVVLAELLKERENPTLIGVVIGTVESISPPRVRLSPELMPSGNKLVISDSYHRRMEKGDEVIVISSSNNKKYFVIDKAVTF